MEGEQALKSGVEYFKGGFSGEQEGLRLKISPDIKLSVLKNTVIDVESGKKKFSGIDGIFVVRDEKGEMHADSQTGFSLGSEVMTEAGIPRVVEALGVLIQIGAKPQEVADFVSNVESKRTREYIKAKFGV